MSRGRSLARRYAMQALYQWQMTGQNVGDVCNQFIAESDFNNVDVEYFRELLLNVPKSLDEIDEALSPFLDRKINEIDPVERAILRLGAFEFRFRLEVPYRVVINESVELAKKFGGENGHKYVNGVLDKVAVKLREPEVKHHKQRSQDA